MPSLQETSDGLSTRVPVALLAFVSYSFPPLICGVVMAVLVLLPHTGFVRVALWPIIVLLAWRAVAFVEMFPSTEPEGKMNQAFFVVCMFGIAARTLDWTLAKGPLVRYYRPANSSPSVIMDALDLVTNLRGHGWEWSNRLHVPQETRSPNRVTFVLYALLSAALHGFIWSVSHHAMQSFVGVGSTDGSTIFDDTLPVSLRSLRVGIMTTLMGLGAYTSMQAQYDLATVIGLLFARQDPAQWPPAFDAPWRATSLSDFWGRRWHQWARRTFLFLGGYPLSVFLGSAGIVIGTFVASGAVHDMLLAGIDSKLEAWRMFAAFGMMAPGILVERAFFRLTGQRVGGVAGWVWTMAWLLVWYSLMLDAFVRAGMIGHSSPPDSAPPLRALTTLIERVVVDFDTWLHSF